MNHITDNHDALLDYLYEEGDPAERLMIATHLQECAACAVAVLEFQNVRGMLGDWTPPASLLGFRMVQDADATPSVTSLSAPESHAVRSGWWRGWNPATNQKKLTSRSSRALYQAAAAVLVFASGMAVSQINVEYRDGVLSVSMRPSAPGRPFTINSPITLAPESTNPDASIDNVPADNDPITPELRDRLQNTNTPSVDTERLLQRVRAMIDQSEQRQQRELALRVSQVAREVETQHQVDVQRIEQNFGQQQDATMEYLVRTSGGAK